MKASFLRLCTKRTEESYTLIATNVRVSSTASLLFIGQGWFPKKEKKSVRFRNVFTFLDVNIVYAAN